MWKYTYNLRGIYETPGVMHEDADAEFARKHAAEEVEHILRKARDAGRTLLDEVESKQILELYGIPTVPTVVADSSTDAAAAAKRFGFPVVLKLYSQTITHKTDVGGVKLNLIDESAVKRAFDEIGASVTERAGAEHFQGVTVQPMIRLKDAYELIIGSSNDAQFGPVLLFGSGGQLVEVYKDRALALPPLNATLARRAMEQTKIYEALKGVRGRAPCNLPALEQVFVRFSQLVFEQSWIKEIDINPLVINSQRMLALDGRVVLHDLSTNKEDLPKPAIRPYPTQYVQHWTLKDGTPITIRPIRPEDEPLMIPFHQSLSDRTVRLRYFHPIKFSQRVEHERLARVCFNDYDRELALVAETREAGGARKIIAIGRLSKTPGGEAGEYAVLVADAWQAKGLGGKLLTRIVEIAKAEKLKTLFAEILPDNTPMLRISEKLGFKLIRRLEDSDVFSELSL
jgi:acetyltransferase